MKPTKRYLFDQIHNDLQKKMVFVGGPRQVGKTTIARQLLGKRTGGYLNWDIPEDRERILKRELPTGTLWIFDEIHKYRKWRDLLKGVYDQYHQQKQILVTGSAHLGFYRYGGDSLQGRYHYLHLHPLSVAELKMTTQKELLELLNLGGFPEPFFSSSAVEAKRWLREYRTRLLEEDIRTLERVQDIGQFELLMLRLPDLVGSPLSLNALRADLQVAHKTVEHWIEILERLYAIFRLSPFGAPQVRANKQAQKHYQVDWTLVQDESFRFENMVAGHLLKWVQFQQDVKGEDVDLRYFRDVDKREIDFIITRNGKPTQAIECKWQDADVSQTLRYFQARFPECEMWQISAIGKKNYITDKIRVAPAIAFLKGLI
ncbi:MAG: ATP-binding protein [Candidatus Kerfeldbacteria bacterium]|nr:ATP-binding protein [Candidatus Kerfeldbacteria bacterium]